MYNSKALIVSDTIEFSGAEEAAVSLAKILSQSNSVTVKLCSTRFLDNALAPLSFEDSLHISTTRPKSIESVYQSIANPTTLAKYVAHCRRVADEFQPNIVHSANLLSIIPSIIIARTMKIPVVAHIHDYRLLSLTDRPFLQGCVFRPTYHKELEYYSDMIGLRKGIFALGSRWLLLSLFNRCDRIIVPSEFMRQQLSNYLRPPIQVIYNGVEIEEKPGKKCDKPTIVYSGRLSLAKGFPVFLKSAELISNLADVEIHVAGSPDPRYPDYTNKVLALANQRRNIFFHGYMPSDELVELIRSSIATVHPFLWPEPASLSIVKSVLLGTPALASNRGSNKELLPPRYLFDPDPNELCKRVAQLIKDPKEFPPVLTIDPSPLTMSAKMSSLYEQVVRKHEN